MPKHGRRFAAIRGEKKMETVTIYEYMVANGKFMTFAHQAEKKNSYYYFKKNNNSRIVHKEDFDVVKSGRVLSLNECEQAAKEMLITHLEEQITKTERSLKITRENLKAVKNVL